MPLEPHNEDRDLVLPADYEHDHPEDRPQDWGWHGEWGGASRVGGWVVAIIMLLMILPAHYNGQGTLFLVISTVLLVIVLLWDRQRRKNAWRQ